MIPPLEAVLPSNNMLRAPSIQVLVNGAALPGVMDVDIHANAHLAADRFRIRAAMAPVDAATLLQPDTLIDLQISLGSTLVSILVGEADSISMDVINNTLDIEGRDLTRRLLDAKTQETFANQTASEIATTLAARNSLAAAITATTTLAGRYYSAEHDRITLGQFSRSTTEWDLLTFLAAREGFEVFVAAQTLYFQPRSQSAPAITLRPQDCLSLSLEHSLTLARDIQVTVKSWNTRHQAAFTQTAKASANGTRASGPPQKIVVVRPNLSTDEALQLAQRILADLSGHERLVHAEIPGELNLTPRSQVALTGTGTDFDQNYYIAELDRSFSFGQGFTQRLRLKNTSVVNDASPPADAPTPVG